MPSMLINPLLIIFLSNHIFEVIFPQGHGARTQTVLPLRQDARKYEIIQPVASGALKWQESICRCLCAPSHKLRWPEVNLVVQCPLEVTTIFQQFNNPGFATTFLQYQLLFSFIRRLWHINGTTMSDIYFAIFLNTSRWYTRNLCKCSLFIWTIEHSFHHQTAHQESEELIKWMEVNWWFRIRLSLHFDLNLQWKCMTQFSQSSGMCSQMTSLLTVSSWLR